ncbi:MobF family relaxase [Nocardioides aurantiacus]|nr:MobF family relaxase [Nocardioides aurantiacus]
MGLHKLTAGDGYAYLTRQVAAHDATEKGHRSLGDYYDERGESPGQWHGSGLTELGLAPGQQVSAEQMRSLFGEGRHPDALALEARTAEAGADAPASHAAGALGRPFQVFAAASRFNTEVARAFSDHNRDHGQSWNTALPAEARAEIRTRVGTRLFTEEHDRPPLDARELSGFIARASRHATTAVAGYDLTFSPVKSVSTLWALAAPPVAAQVRAAHDAAVADTLRWLEHEAVFTRLGRGGVRQVPTRGLIAATFTHRDSRAGDPDLHTHVAISNKVQVVADLLSPTGEARWLALDGRMLYQANVAASERYNTRLEAELTTRLGVRFADSPTTPDDRRPVREIDGINTVLTGWWSRRRRAIDVRRAQLASDFQARHGRPPTAVEAIGLAQQATLETRAAKHAPRSERDQRTTWRNEADHVLGGPAEVDHMLARVLRTRPRPATPDHAWTTEAAAAVIEAVESRRATWQVWHLRAEAERQARAANLPRTDLDMLVDDVVDQALASSVRLGVPDPVPEPATLQRPDGSSMYDVHGSTRYTSARILAAEQQILATAERRGRRAVTDVRVEIALAASAADGVTLNDAQAAMVRELATSGALLQLALAPAGTGKTTAMRTLTHAWSQVGGTVVGLAPSAQAAHELRSAIDPAGGHHNDTLAKLTWTITHQAPALWPPWIHDIGPDTMVVLDEAGQAATTDLASAIAYVTGRGGVVRLIGDDQQLAAVSAGGVLRDLQRTHGAVTLSQVRRFDDPAEAAATLALRDGDTSSLGFYADHDRIHVGDRGAATDQAYAAWTSDRAAGLDTVLLAPTRDLVAQLNGRARDDRLTSGPSLEHIDEVVLGDGNHASVGDVIVTRRNDRTLALSATDWVTNGDRWTVTAVHPDHSITARHHGLARHRRLPADYVAQHVQLGYATTVHGAQGMTTDTTHAVVTGDEARQLLYVALTRGRRANHLYLATGHDGDPHSAVHPETLRPLTALDVLTQVIERDGTQESATTTRHQATSPAAFLRDAVARYRDALHHAAEQVLTPTVLTALDGQLEALHPGITDRPAYPALRSRIALLSLDHRDPIETVAASLAIEPADRAQDPEAVVESRLANDSFAVRDEVPLPWLDHIPQTLAADPTWGTYLAARTARITNLATAVREQTHSWTPTTAPRWATPLTDPEHPDLLADLAVWRAAHNIPDTVPRPTGPLQQSARSLEHQRHLDRRVRCAHPGARDHRHDIDAELPAAVTMGVGRSALVERLSRLQAVGVPVPDLLDTVTRDTRPLPDDCAADALWWRIVRHLGPAALQASGDNARTLRPDWAPALVSALGDEIAQRVMDDPNWPALVAAIGARPSDWTADALITAVTHTTGPMLPAEELCAALVWRTALMTDPPDDLEDAEPPEPPQPNPELPAADVSMTVPACATPVERVVQLNSWAMDHFEDLYPRSWAPGYMLQRLGTDLFEETRFRVGYAPPGPTHLVRHLTSRGATVAELLDAGLTRRRDDGRITDVFRDRLVFPIYSHNQLLGFVARRNPTKDDTSYAGPKYLNTRATRAFSKGRVLFGMDEATRSLDAGAVPVLVEGPLDAIAITTTSPRHIGVAPLGTAFTERQAQSLRPYFRRDRTRIVVATDGDRAGWLAARKAFWQLAALGADPRHLRLGAGLDPAAMAATSRSALLEALAQESSSLGFALLDDLVQTSELPDVASRLWLSRSAAPIIAATPPEGWPDLISSCEARAQLPPGVLPMEVLEAAESWDQDPTGTARRQLRRLAAEQPTPPPERNQGASNIPLGHLSPDQARSVESAADLHRCARPVPRP